MPGISIYTRFSIRINVGGRNVEVGGTGITRTTGATFYAGLGAFSPRKLLKSEPLRVHFLHSEARIRSKKSSSRSFFVSGRLHSYCCGTAFSWTVSGTSISSSEQVGSAHQDPVELPAASELDPTVSVVVDFSPNHMN